MKKRLFIALCVAAAGLCFGCTPYYVKVTQHRTKSTPLTNIITVYVDEACNFSLADSTGYNICLKTHFDDTTSVKKRNRVEQMISGDLTTRGTAVYGSCDLLGVKNADMTVDNSYSYFRKLVDSLHVDGILVVQLQNVNREHPKNNGMYMPGPVGANGLSTGGTFVPGPDVVETGFYGCYMLDPKDLLHPIWSGEMKMDGRELNRRSTKQLAKALINEGYTVH